RLFVHLTRLAASRTFWTAGSNSAIKTPIMAITTNSSIRVNPRRDEQERMANPLTGEGTVAPTPPNGRGVEANAESPSSLPTSPGGGQERENRFMKSSWIVNNSRCRFRGV